MTTTSKKECNNGDLEKRKRKLVYDLGNINPVYCGLGCQLHGISAAFLCSSENHRQFSIINFPRKHYESYFNAFKFKCSQHENRTKTSKFKHLLNLSELNI